MNIGFVAVVGVGSFVCGDCTWGLFSYLCGDDSFGKLISSGCHIGGLLGPRCAVFGVFGS